ncbi:hypothetical protein [Devosia sp. Leaf64]|uniref:hypothetical protein n=1 Tax=Devosia sp. Leaf64 TaxID=1736229 RepID=UPI00071329A0|nr:hypothetical protein [Devosia sp. Leaf64]KQN75037.1 hypothetical protein ASE94_01580 [Devosia sp. Leaf64]
MADENAASAATGSCTPNSDILRNARWALEKRADVLLDRYVHDGEWVGDFDQAQEFAEIHAAIHGINHMESLEELTGTNTVVDVVLPSGQSFTAIIERDLAEELQRCLDRLKLLRGPDGCTDSELVDQVAACNAAILRIEGGGDPEASARSEFARRDAARGTADIMHAFEVDPVGSYTFSGGSVLLLVKGDLRSINAVAEAIHQLGFDVEKVGRA